MLTLTQAAGEHLSKLLDESDANDEAAVRLVAREQGLALAADQPRPEDTTFEHDGKTVLILDQQVAEALADRTLDVQDTENGKALAIS